MPGRPKTKSTKDYRVLVKTSTSGPIKCTLCGDEIKSGQAYYYKIGDEMHTVCEK